MGAQISRCGLLTILALASAFVLSPNLHAEASRSLTPAERFVRDRVEAGREAELNDSKLEDHSLSVEFLQDLISGRYKTPELERQGVKVSHAVVKDTLVVASQTVSYPLWLRSCEFEKGVDFEYTRFDRDLSFEGSNFHRPKTDSQSSNMANALFVGIKVDGTLNFRHTTFDVPLNLTYAEVAGELIFDSVRYRSSENADFENVKVKEPAFFEDDYFAGKIVLADAQMFELIIIHPWTPIDLDLTQAHIDQVLTIQSATLSSFRAPGLVATGDATFDQVVPVGSVYLVRSHFQDLTIIGFDNWLKAAVRPVDPASHSCSLNIEGLSFEGIDIPGARVEPEASRLLDLIKSNQCAYSPQPYMELEKFLRFHGYPNKADDVFIAMHESERKRLSPWKWPFDWLLDVLVGYGREPWRAIIGAVFLAIFGAFLFRQAYMEPEDKSTDSWYNPFWYSLDLLSPIDLGIAKKWRAGKSHSGMRHYAQIHRLLGWILIPLIVAAITGIIK